MKRTGNVLILVSRFHAIEKLTLHALDSLHIKLYKESIFAYNQCCGLDIYVFTLKCVSR